MNQQDATAVAQDYITLQNQDTPFHPEYEYEVAAPDEYFDCWYFDYRIVSRLGVPENEQELFAGAPGFTVSKANGSITVISWDVQRKLPQREALFQKFSILADTLTSSKLDVRMLRKHFTTPLAELAQFKHSLDAPSLTQLQKKELLISQLMQEAELPL
ncbi:hypothetical protein [Hymenobacter pini]|uniref:hypothetical protein n=1 Tax=Hymenobacter pini TaxID=2880879 RepID=UPI001CF18D80|nr:hypothetical protein [Hymenobacter pini]MCA8830413.1 hypothetical protein [Hymenobacter pini]